MDPFNFVSLSPSSAASSVPLLDSSDEASDERTSFVRSAKSHRKYGSTTSGSSMNDSSSPSRFHPSCHMEHRVEPGDTLAGLALRYHTTMEYIKRINKMWTSDSLFLRESILVPVEDVKVDTDGFARLMIENETNGTVFPILDATCTEIPPVFPEVSLSSMNLQKKTDLGPRTSSASSNSSTSIDCEKSIHDYLGDIDSQIKEAKSKAHKLQKTSDVLKSHPEVNQDSWPRSQASTRLRLSLSELGGEFNAATSSPDHVPSTAVVGGGRGRKAKSMYNHRERSQENEIFEL